MSRSNKLTGPYSVLIRIAALLLPVYFIFYGPLHENKGSRINPLWNFVFAGFAIYIVVALLIFL